MPKILPEFEEKIRAAIRDAWALDSTITIVSLQATLDKKFHREFKREYIAKMVRKMSGEFKRTMDTAQVKEDLQRAHETYRLNRQRLLRIIYWSADTATPGIKPPFHKEIVEAVVALTKLDLEFIEAKVRNGWYQKPLDAIAKEVKYEPLPPEIRKVVVASWKRAGLLPNDVIEAMVPKAQLPMMIEKK